MTDLITKNIGSIRNDFADNMFQYLTTDTYKSAMNVSFSNAYTYLLLL